MATQVIGRLATIRTTYAIDAADGAYTASDVVSSDNCSTTSVAWTFTGCAHSNGRGGAILTAMIISESESITPRLRLYLFNDGTLTGQKTDNSAATSPNHADLAKVTGVIDFPAMTSNGDDSWAIATPSTTGNLPLYFTCAADDDDLYGILVTLDAFTQTATDDMTIIMVIDQW